MTEPLESVSTPALTTDLIKTSVMVSRLLDQYFFAHSASYCLFFKSHLITDFKSASDCPGLFPGTFLPKYFRGVYFDGNRGIFVDVLIPQTYEWCRFPNWLIEICM